MFWHGETADSPPLHGLLDQERDVPGVARVDADQVLAACRAAFGAWHIDGNLWIAAPDADGNGPGFDLGIYQHLVSFTCYGLAGDQMNQIIDVMNGLGYPLYDPQTGERFAL